jgi:hypothetical protein
MGAIDERLGEIELAAVAQIGREPVEELLEDAVLHPGLEPPMARRWRWISARKVCPRCAGAEDPEHAVDDVTWVPPGAASLLRGTPALTRGEASLDRVPLLVGEIHPHL